MITIEQYLQGLFAYTFTDQNMASVLVKRGIEAGSDQEDVSTESKELATADLYMVLFNVFTKGNETVQKGNWKRSSAGITVGITDRKAFRDMANQIYLRYGEQAIGGGIMKDGSFLWT
jgi:hypothetical protein